MGCRYPGCADTVTGHVVFCDTHHALLPGAWKVKLVDGAIPLDETVDRMVEAINA